MKFDPEKNPVKWLRDACAVVGKHEPGQDASDHWHFEHLSKKPLAERLAFFLETTLEANICDASLSIRLYNPASKSNDLRMFTPKAFAETLESVEPPSIYIISKIKCFRLRNYEQYEIPIDVSKFGADPTDPINVTWQSWLHPLCIADGEFDNTIVFEYVPQSNGNGQLSTSL